MKCDIEAYHANHGPALNKVEMYHESIKEYFGDDIYNPMEVGKHVQQMFRYCDEHQVFWTDVVYSKCPMCPLRK